MESAEVLNIDIENVAQISTALIPVELPIRVVMAGHMVLLVTFITH